MEAAACWLAYIGEETSKTLSRGMDDVFSDEGRLCIGVEGGVAVVPKRLDMLSRPPSPAELDGEGDFSMVLIMSKNKERSLIRSSYVPLS